MSKLNKVLIDSVVCILIIFSYVIIFIRNDLLLKYVYTDLVIPPDLIYPSGVVKPAYIILILIRSNFFSKVIIPLLVVTLGSIWVSKKALEFSKLQAIKEFETTSEWRKNLMKASTFIEDIDREQLKCLEAVSTLRASIVHKITPVSSSIDNLNLSDKEQYFKLLSQKDFSDKEILSKDNAEYDKYLKYLLYLDIEKLYNFRYSLETVYDDNYKEYCELIRIYARLLLKVNWEFNQVQIREGEKWLDRNIADNLHNRMMAKYYFEYDNGPPYNKVNLNNSISIRVNELWKLTSIFSKNNSKIECIKLM